MTDNERSAKAILSEALDTIKATYWVEGMEFKFAYGNVNYIPDTGMEELDWTSWDRLEKAIPVQMGSMYFPSDDSEHPVVNDGIAKVIGVCSIGALALANVTLYDEPLDAWAGISQRDPHTWLAGAALVMAIITHDAELPDVGDEGYDENRPRIIWPEAHFDHGGLIAAWNDYAGRTREEVIAAFERALASPLATATEVYTLGYTGWNDIERRASFFSFASEDEAQAFLDGDSVLRNWTKQNLSMADWQIVPAARPALVL